MKNNRNMKRFILIEFSLFIFIVLVSIIGSVMIFNIYEEKLEENNAYILTNLVKDNKELEEKVVKFILENEYGNEEIDTTLLEKYGITKEDLKFSSSTNELKNKIIKYDIVFIVTSFLILTLTFIIYTVNENKKIKSISNYLNEILNGNYHMDVRDYDEGVISHLKNDIYKVTIKLKEQHDLSIKDKKNLEETLSDISHQLKTPLTSMYVINDLLETDIDKDVKKELLLKNYSQLERIEWLVTSLLKISRLDSKTVVLKEKKEKAIEVIEKAVEPLRIPMELKDVDLFIECPKNTVINVDFNWTVEALLNVVKNAYEHTHSKGKVSIKVRENPLYVAIDIKDTGSGISDKDINHIFERFYKGEGNSESIGIGLNMAKKIIDLEHGEIRVDSKVGVGTTFTIRFYRNVI